MNKKRLLYFIQNYRFQSLFIKNLLLILILTMVPFAGTSIAVYYQMNSVVQEEISSVSLNSLYRVRDVVDTVIKQTDLMATKLSLQPEVELFVFSDRPDQILNMYYKEIYRAISMFTSVYKYIDSIYVFSELNQYIIADSSGKSFEQFTDQNWYPLFKMRTNNDPWMMPRKKEDKYPYYLTLIRPTYIYNEQQNGAVIVNIDVEELGKVISGQRHRSDELLYIVGSDGTVLFSDVRDDFMLHIQDSRMLSQVSMHEESGSNVIRGEHYVVSVIGSELFDWKYVSLLPVTHFEEKTKVLRNFMVAFSVIGLLVIILVSFVISVKSFAPVRQIISAFNNPLKDEIEKYNSPEMKMILSHIKRTDHSQREMELELERRLTLLNKAKSVALQSQINPHFLFNTLDTIRWTAIRLTRSNNDVSIMLSSLSDLLRLSTDSDSHLISLEHEVQHAKKYIDILRYRYGDKVEVFWDIPESLLSYRTVQLSLQPLIENAVYHGIKPMRRRGHIWISAKSIGRSLCIEVRDDGKGMSSSQMERLNDSFHEEHDLSGKHIGLQNVNQRIKLIFGEHYGLSIFSDGEEGHGTKVTIWLPMDDVSELEMSNQT